MSGYTSASGPWDEHVYGIPYDYDDDPRAYGYYE
jgi:hypothetical protein